jgi:hypothetical protein
MPARLEYHDGVFTEDGTIVLFKHKEKFVYVDNLKNCARSLPPVLAARAVWETLPGASARRAGDVRGVMQAQHGGPGVRNNPPLLAAVIENLATGAGGDELVSRGSSLRRVAEYVLPR